MMADFCRPAPCSRSATAAEVAFTASGARLVFVRPAYPMLRVDRLPSRSPDAAFVHFIFVV